MIRWVIALLLLGLAVGANAALLLREPARPSTPLGQATINLDGIALVAPRAMIRDPAQQAGGRLLRLDLAVTRSGFNALPPTQRGAPPMPASEVITLTLSNPGLQAPPADQLQQLYARFLLPETVNSPSGLVMRRFRPGSPYDDKELYIGAGQLGGQTGRLFIALCPKSGIQDIESCTARLRQDKVEVELRFSPATLGDWRQMGTATLALVERLRSEAAR